MDMELSNPALESRLDRQPPGMAMANGSGPPLHRMARSSAWAWGLSIASGEQSRLPHDGRQFTILLVSPTPT